MENKNYLSDEGVDPLTITNNVSNMSPFFRDNHQTLDSDFNLNVDPFDDQSFTRRHSMAAFPGRSNIGTIGGPRLNIDQRRPTYSGSSNLFNEENLFSWDLNDDLPTSLKTPRNSYVAPGPHPLDNSSPKSLTHQSSNDNLPFERRGSRFDFASQNNLNQSNSFQSSSPLNSTFAPSSFDSQPNSNTVLGLDLNQRSPFNLNSPILNPPIIPKLLNQSPLPPPPPPVMTSPFQSIPMNPLNLPMTQPNQQPRFFPFDLNPPPSLQSNLSDLGRGIPLSTIPPKSQLFIVEFKAARNDLFYCIDSKVTPTLNIGDLVIVEADRGKDLGKISKSSITIEDVHAFQKQQAELALSGSPIERRPSMNINLTDEAPSPKSSALPINNNINHNINNNNNNEKNNGNHSQSESFEALKTLSKDLQPKRIFAKASASETQLLITKRQDESKALQICVTKVKQRKLPMEVIDAEYQWDRRKLTFYFISEQRIDFRDLVRELFRGFKTRIWMSNISATANASLISSARLNNAQNQHELNEYDIENLNINDESGIDNDNNAHDNINDNQLPSPTSNPPPIPETENEHQKQYQQQSNELNIKIESS